MWSHTKIVPNRFGRIDDWKQTNKQKDRQAKFGEIYSTKEIQLSVLYVNSGIAD